MQENARCAVAVLLIALGGLCGCSAQKTVARSLSEADRVIVMNRNAGDFRMPLTAEETRKLVQAISIAKKDPLVLANVELRIEFFKGTNLLETLDVSASVGVFGIGGVPYVDRTGTLKEIDARFRAEEAAATNSVAR